MRDMAAILKTIDRDSMASDNPPIQIGLRLYPAQLEALDIYCTEKGLDRTSAVRMAINQLLEGSPAAIAPVATSGGSGVDQEARDAMTKLAARMKEMQESLMKVELMHNALEKREAMLAALEAEKTKPAPAPFELDI